MWSWHILYWKNTGFHQVRSRHDYHYSKLKWITCSILPNFARLVVSTFGAIQWLGIVTVRVIIVMPTNHSLQYQYTVYFTTNNSLGLDLSMVVHRMVLRNVSRLSNTMFLQPCRRKIHTNASGCQLAVRTLNINFGCKTKCCIPSSLLFINCAAVYVTSFWLTYASGCFQGLHLSNSNWTSLRRLQVWRLPAPCLQAPCIFLRCVACQVKYTSAVAAAHIWLWKISCSLNLEETCLEMVCCLFACTQASVLHHTHTDKPASIDLTEIAQQFSADEMCAESMFKASLMVKFVGGLLNTPSFMSCP